MDLLILLGCFHFCWFEFGCSRDLPGMRGWGGVWWGVVGWGGVGWGGVGWGCHSLTVGVHRLCLWFI